MSGSEEIDGLLAIAAQERTKEAAGAAIRALDAREVYYRASVTTTDGKQRVTAPLLRLEDGSHALVVYTSKSHPELPEKFGGAPWRHALTMAAGMPQADWLIVTNERGDWLPINKVQVRSILKGFAKVESSQTDGSQSASQATNADLEELISGAVNAPVDSWYDSLLSRLTDRELFVRIANKPAEDGRPILVTSEVDGVRGLVQAYTSRSREGIAYGGMTWAAIAGMVKASSEIGGVHIINDSDDWVVLSRSEIR